MATPIPENFAETTTDDVARVTGGFAVAGSPRVHRGITTDSRAVRPGSTFVALRGENHDGHAFVPSAIERGATLLVVEKGREPKDAPPCDVVVVEDTLVAWGAMAAAHLARWRDGRKVIAITGSVGKTTTKELCAALLASASTPESVRFTDGNLNNRIGVPAMIFTLEERHRFAVLECGMSLPGEMAKLAAIVKPDVAALTNIGLAHAENVGGTREGVAGEKSALLAGAQERGTVVLSADDPLSLAQAACVPGRAVVTFGRAANANVKLAARTGRGFIGSELQVERGAESFVVDLPIVGEGAAVDFACALASVEAALGRPLGPAEVARALASLPAAPGRAQVRVRPDGAVIVDDTYNASPQSMANALASLSELARAEKRRAICVLGEMRELGPVAASAHDELGDVVADAGVALFVGCGGPMIGRALERAAARGVATRAGGDAEEAGKIAKLEVSSGDVVLVKGSRSIGTERAVRILLGDP